MDLPFEFDMEALKTLISDFDLMDILPELADLMTWLVTIVEYALVIGPMILVALGLLYLLLPTKEANHIVGYRFFWGMGSIQSWRFTQRLAGAVWTVLGLVLMLEANEFRQQLAGMENLDMMYESITLLLRQVFYVVVSCLGVNLAVFLIFNFNGEVRWLWRLIVDQLGRFGRFLMGQIRKATGGNGAQKAPKAEKEQKEKRQRRAPDQNNPEAK